MMRVYVCDYPYARWSSDDELAAVDVDINSETATHICLCSCENQVQDSRSLFIFLNIFRCLDIRGFLSQRLQFSVALNPPIMHLSCHRIITLY